MGWGKFVLPSVFEPAEVHMSGAAAVSLRAG